MRPEDSLSSETNCMRPYFLKQYDAKERFISYWHQIHEALKAKPTRLLEIGIGNGLVNQYLRGKGLKVTTLDLDYRLTPDITGSVLSLPISADAFDVIICCEVLEHLPYDKFTTALKELWRITSNLVILSVPDATTVYRIDIELPRLKPIRKLLAHPFPRAKPHVFDGEHYWEIGKKGYPLKKVEADIQKAGLRIAETYRIFELPYHRFFVLYKH